jgi:hypothetical protein
MAIVRCPECGGPVSTHARACPACGCDFDQHAQSRPMHPDDKKWWVMVAVVVTAVIVYAVASSDPPRDELKVKNDQEMARLRDAYNGRR